MRPFRMFLPLLCLLSAAAPASADITVFAAASLKTALDQVVAGWQGAKGEPVRVSYAGSAQLAKQIEAGAPADLFISASEAWMDYLAAAEAIDPASRRDLFGNTLVLVIHGAAERLPPVGPGFPLDERLAGGKLAMAFVDSVPAGIYGRQALQSLGLWQGVEAQVVQAENVRAALALVATGEAPLGVVYATDAVAEPRVSVLAAFPDDSHDPIVYPAALTRDAGAGAAAFLDHLSAPEARAVFVAQGFTAPP